MIKRALTFGMNFGFLGFPSAFLCACFSRLLWTFPVSSPASDSFFTDSTAFSCTFSGTTDQPAASAAARANRSFVGQSYYDGHPPLYRSGTFWRTHGSLASKCAKHSLRCLFGPAATVTSHSRRWCVSLSRVITLSPQARRYQILGNDCIVGEAKKATSTSMTEASAKKEVSTHPQQSKYRGAR